jgi:hypothetical protein
MKPTNIQMQKAGAQTDILTMAYLPLLIWSVRPVVLKPSGHCYNVTNDEVYKC